MPLVSFRSNNQHDKSHFAPKIRVGTTNSYRGLYRFVRLICETLKSKHLYGKGASLSMCVLALACSGPQKEIVETAKATPSLTQLTSTTETETDADWSPDGKWIAYADEGDSSNISIIPSGGGVPRQVTTGPERDILPRWSPNGDKLLFVSYRGNGQRNVWTISPDGGTESLFQVTSDADSVGQNLVNWSPDGKKIAYAATRGQHVDVWTISAQGKNARQITNAPGLSWDPDWSPDGKWIVYNHKSENDSFEGVDLWIVSADGGDARVLLSEAGPQFCPAWSPDGKWIAYCGLRPNEGLSYFAVWLFPSNGGTPQRVSDASYANFRPQWGPDSRRLVYDAVENTGIANIYDLQTQSARVFAPSIANNHALAWSPDGQWIAYVLRAPDGWDIWRKPVAGGNPLRMTTNGFFSQNWSASLSWSPDGQSIAFNSNEGGETAIWTVPIAGGEPDRITVGVGDNEAVGEMNWSPDGHTIVFDTISEGNWNIWTVPSSGGIAKKLVDWPGNEGNASWSPDGQKIAFQASGSPTVENTQSEFERAIWILSVADGQVKKLTDGSQPYWTLGGNEIFFVRGQGELFKIPVDGGNVVRVPKTENHPWHNRARLRWSPDGSQILYGNFQNRNLWIADIAGLVN